METVSFMWTIVLIGIGTVFICLICLVAMVSLFKLIFVREAKPAQSPVAVPTTSGAGKGMDPAVVAVIIAAIAVSSGVPAASIRLASIQQASFNTPVWGYVDRVVSGAINGRA